MPRVAISMAPAAGSWGGSSPFVAQLSSALLRRGFGVQYRLHPAPDAIVMIDPRADRQLKRFGAAEIEAFHRVHPRVPVIHRVNECDQRKGTTDVDERLREANEIADHTIFISEWLRDYFIQRWFDRQRPHGVIYNGADPRVFHPFGNALPRDGENVRVVTHHWSSNWMKGFDVYADFDERLARGEFPGVEFIYIGRWPDGFTWKAATGLKPRTGRELASELRRSHLYLTASRWEPCGMHHVEGTQCGLPLLYHLDGGGIVEAGERYGIGFREDFPDRLREAVARLPELRARALAHPPSGDHMAVDFVGLIQRLVATAAP